ncbi:FAD synthetase family protein [Paenibacillus periandrae]|uniref:FAD synthetase family protein n=1 Tax=Paenibacillus periandrae TaxID=1761741 RepID=UPI001F096F2C|nr:FAD synthetase family protein [Paenibacillus periandrae]
MKTVWLERNPDLLEIETKPCVMAVGFFDGVHIGHTKLIVEAQEIANRLQVELAVMTFYPHPREVLSKGKSAVDYLMTNMVKAETFAALGVDTLYMVSFSPEFAALSSERFVKEYLAGLNAACVVVGFDFTYGFQGKGNTESLVKEADGLLEVVIFPKCELDGEKVSSSMVRSLLHKGEVTKAAQFLGRPYQTQGIITGVKKDSTGVQGVVVSMYRPFTLPSSDFYHISIELENKLLPAIGLVVFEEKSSEVHVFFQRTILMNLNRSRVKIDWIRRARIITAIGNWMKERRQ